MIPSCCLSGVDADEIGSRDDQDVDDADVFEIERIKILEQNKYDS